MAATWTALADKANLDVITPTIWNAILGDEGNLQYAYERLVAVKYKTAAQVFTTSTTQADITAASGNFAFNAVASGQYVGRIALPMTYGGAGGLKLEFSGPAAPTLFIAEVYGSVVVRTGFDNAANTDSWRAIRKRLATLSAFSSDTTIGASGGVEADVLTPGTGTAGLLADTIEIDFYLLNGSTAGDVTLRGAQSAASSTTTFGAGARMRVWKV